MQVKRRLNISLLSIQNPFNRTRFFIGYKTGVYLFRRFLDGRAAPKNWIFAMVFQCLSFNPATVAAGVVMD